MSSFSRSFTNYLSHGNLNSFYLYPTNSDEINKINKNFKNRKSTGLNSTPTEILNIDLYILF